jgi:putative transposase
MRIKSVLHGDDGFTLRTRTILAMFDSRREALVLATTRQLYLRHSEIRISHRQLPPRVPGRSLRRIPGTRALCCGLLRWYDLVHRSSGIRYVVPAQQHTSDDHAIVPPRAIRQSRQLNPPRWLRWGA